VVQRQPFRWNLVRRYDPAYSGFPKNVVVYRWMRRAQSSGRGYLTDIYYTPAAAAVDERMPVETFAHHVRLEWEPNGGRGRTPVPIWRATPELVLTRIDVASKLDRPERPRALVRRYHLGYSGILGRRTHLTSFQMEGRCAAPVFEVSEALAATSCPRLPATTLRYSKQIVQRDLPALIRGRRVATMDVTPGLNIIPLDVNSDGLPDLLDTYVDPSKNRQAVHLGGEGAVDTFVYGPAAGHPFGKTGYTLTGDLLGNGSTSAYFIVPSPPGTVGQGPFVYSAKPAVDPPNMVWVQGLGPVAVDAPQWPDPMELAGDVDGDGLLDRVNWASLQGQAPFNNLRPYDASLWSQWESKGFFHTLFSRRYGPYIRANVPQPPLNRPLSTAALTHMAPSREMLDYFKWPGDKHAIFLADLNGDSPRSLPGFQVEYWPGDGRGNFTACVGVGCRVTWPGSKVPSLPMLQGPLGPDVAPNRIQFADLNGDGLADLITWGQDGIRIHLNWEGWAFSDPIFLPGYTVTDGLGGWANDQDPDLVRIAFADINGNGINDLLVIISGRVWAVDLQGNDFYAGSFVPDDDFAPRGGLLVEIDNGLGASTQVMYQSTADLYRASQRAGKPWPEPLPQIMMVVGRVTTRTNEPAPYGIRRQITYSYSDPVWDGWERRFLGFREVVTTEGDPAFGPAAAVSSRQTYFIPACPQRYCGSADASYVQQRTVSGAPLISETFDAEGRYLSTISRSYKVVPSMPGLDGRAVRFSYLSQIDTRLYDHRTWSPFDGVLPFTVQGAEMSWTGLAPVRSRNNVLLRRTQRLDTNGRLLEATDHGRIKDDGGPVDDPIVRNVKVGALRGDWRFLAESVRVEPFPVRMSPPTPTDMARDRRFEYDAAGRLKAVYAKLTGTLPLDRRHEDPARQVAQVPSSASRDGDVRLAQFTYDEFDNVTYVVEPAGRCEQRIYDADFSQLAVQRIALGGAAGSSLAGCGGIQHRTRLAWDRGLGVVVSETNPQGASTTMTYDGFGRPSEVFSPDPATGLPSALPSARVSYFTAPGGPVQRARVQQRTGAASWREVWGYTDGLGAPLLSLEQADKAAGDGGDWLVSGLSRHDGQGLASNLYEPWFYDGDPAAHPLTPPGSPATSVDRDRFGRVTAVRGPDGAAMVRHGYGALAVDSIDEDGQAEQVTIDGHGRPITAIRRAGGETIVTRIIYQALGEPAVVVRVHSGGPSEVMRWTRHDSLGRMVLNAEPNTSENFSPDPSSAAGMRSWRYAYDDAGQLVGTSDARGCGKNLHYDRLGRLVAEDYSPCLNAHELYSPLDLSAGTGAEVWNRYDFAEPGQTGDFGISAANLHGRLVSRLDRAGHTRMATTCAGAWFRPRSVWPGRTPRCWR
jgi:YD repeat-containing protein